jgi:hypothetical protein
MRRGLLVMNRWVVDRRSGTRKARSRTPTREKALYDARMTSIITTGCNPIFRRSGSADHAHRPTLETLARAGVGRTQEIAGRLHARRVGIEGALGPCRMQVRTSGWILVASGVAITALFACSEGQWAKDPLPTCDEGDEDCGSGNKNSGTNKGSKPKTPSGTPTPAETQSTTEENNEDPPAGNQKPDASTTTPPKDAGSNPPTKGPNCLSNQNTCIAITLKCGCPEDCCAGTVCAQVGGLVQNTCCKITASPCTSHSECCGQLLCKANASGTGMSCQ